MRLDDDKVMRDVSRALGRSAPPASVPAPPAIDETIVRLVQFEIGLPELFAKTAAANNIDVELIRPDDLAERLISFLREKAVSHLAIPAGGLLAKLDLPRAIAAAGIIVAPWSDLSVEELFDYEAGLTDAYAAVAETGSIVIRGSKEHGRSLSLIPPIHVCVLEPKDFVGDLVDLFEKLQAEGIGSGVTIISGPSKTADIELNLVTGVHGPGVVKCYVLQ